MRPCLTCAKTVATFRRRGSRAGWFCSKRCSNRYQPGMAPEGFAGADLFAEVRPVCADCRSVLPDGRTGRRCIPCRVERALRLAARREREAQVRKQELRRRKAAKAIDLRTTAAVTD
mgnify:FL=1